MANYHLTAVNVGSFPLGESDKVLTLFSAERGLIRAVAKGVRKPGTKIGGRSELLRVNKLMLATGRSLDIIVQAEEVSSYSSLRKDLAKLCYGLYYAELTAHFGQGLGDESKVFFKYLCDSLERLSGGQLDPALLCLQFELHLLQLLGLMPELDFCVNCRTALTDSNVSRFDYEEGGIVCADCSILARQVVKGSVGEHPHTYQHNIGQHNIGQHNIGQYRSFTTYLTPLVWRRLILASGGLDQKNEEFLQASVNSARANAAGRRLIQTYINYKAGRKMKSLELLQGL